MLRARQLLIPIAGLTAGVLSAFAFQSKTGSHTIAQSEAGQKDRSPDAQEQKWTHFLNDTFKNLKSPVLFDADTNADPPNVVLPNGGTSDSLLATLAGLTRHDLSVVKGTNVLRRSSRNPGVAQEPFVSKILQWLDALGPSQIQSLAHDGLDYSSMDDSSKSVLAQLSTHMSSVIQQPIADGQQVHVSLRLMPIAHVRDSRTGKESDIILDAKYPEGKEEAAAPKELRQSNRTTPSQRKLEGAVLSFRDGQLIDLESLLVKAGTTFAVRYRFDSRLAKTSVYAKGEFDETSFDAAIGELYKINPPEPSREDYDKARALKRLLDGPLKGLFSDNPLKDDSGDLTGNDFLNGKEMTAKDLADKNQYFRKIMEQRGFDSATSVTLRSGLALVLWADGSSRVTSGSAQFNGQSMPVYQQNRLVYGIKP